MGSEDFSFVARAGAQRLREPRACAPPTTGSDAPDNHSPRAAFDDAFLPDATALLAELALRRLSR